eukprot:Pompholyxophrys_sp_v1_NODE_31_length_3649_cov_4.542571.p3 type:complete len:126 gc:universal NODE_31_length_3649_cov_4.542571:3179-3556(+)
MDAIVISDGSPCEHSPPHTTNITSATPISPIVEPRPTSEVGVFNPAYPHIKTKPDNMVYLNLITNPSRALRAAVRLLHSQKELASFTLRPNGDNRFPHEEILAIDYWLRNRPFPPQVLIVIHLSS